MVSQKFMQVKFNGEKVTGCNMKTEKFCKLLTLVPDAPGGIGKFVFVTAKTMQGLTAGASPLEKKMPALGEICKTVNDERIFTPGMLG